MLLYLISSALGVSLIGNVMLTIFLFKKPRVKQNQTYDVQCLLRDLASGTALVQMQYLDRADVLLRSPRHYS